MRCGFLAAVVAATLGVVCERAGAAALVPVEVRLSASARQVANPLYGTPEVLDSPAELVVAGTYGGWAQVAKVENAWSTCSVTFDPNQITLYASADGASFGGDYAFGWGSAKVVFDLNERVLGGYAGAFNSEVGGFSLKRDGVELPIPIDLSPWEKTVLEPGRYTFEMSHSTWVTAGWTFGSAVDFRIVVPEPAGLCGLLLGAPLLLARRKRVA